MRKLAIVLVVAAASGLSGCAATGVALSKHELDVQTKMTDSIFLDPPAPGHKKVLVQVRNTSDKTDFTITPQLRAALAQRGWSLTDDPNKADYMLQVNVLKVGKSDQTAAQQMFNSGYGGALGTGLLGAAGSYAVHGPGFNRTGVAAGLLAAGAEFVTGQLVKDVYYTVLTDVQISERTDGKVRTTGEQNLRQGTSGTEKVSYQEDNHWRRYRTRILSTANQVNLDWPEAQPALETGMVQSIAGLL